MIENTKPIYGLQQYPYMDLFYCENPTMDIVKTIGENITALMQPPSALDTCMKVAAKSGVSFGTVQRVKNGEVNITVEKLSLIADAFKVHPSVLLAPLGDYASDQDQKPPNAGEPEADRYAVFSPPVTEVIEIMESLTHAQQRDVAAAVKMYLLTYNKDEKNSTQRAGQ